MNNVNQSSTCFGLFRAWTPWLVQASVNIANSGKHFFLQQFYFRVFHLTFATVILGFVKFFLSTFLKHGVCMDLVRRFVSEMLPIGSNIKSQLLPIHQTLVKWLTSVFPHWSVFNVETFGRNCLASAGPSFDLKPWWFSRPLDWPPRSSSITTGKTTSLTKSSAWREICKE